MISEVTGMDKMSKKKKPEVGSRERERDSWESLHFWFGIKEEKLKKQANQSRR